MSAIWIILIGAFGYIIPGYYFHRWELEFEIENKGYCTLGHVLFYAVFALIPIVNIILFLIVGVATEKLFSKRFY